MVVMLNERSLWTRLDLSATAGLARRTTQALLRAAAARAGGQLQTLQLLLACGSAAVSAAARRAAPRNHHAAAASVMAVSRVRSSVRLGRASGSSCSVTRMSAHSGAGTCGAMAGR